MSVHRAKMPVFSGKYVGREKESRLLTQKLAEAARGNGSVVLLAGDAGSGKTRMAVEAVTAANQQGFHAAWATCWSERRSPFFVWTELVESLRASRDPQPLAHAARGFAGDADEILAVLRGQVRGPALAPSADNSRVFSSVSEFFRRVADQVGLLVLSLDDLQWADPDSLSLLRVLARQVRDTRLLIIGTFRESDVPTQTALGDALAELARHGAYVRVDVRNLTRDDVYALIAADTPLRQERGKAVLTDWLYRKTSGNPFFIDQMFRHLKSIGYLEPDDEDERWAGDGELLDSLGIPGEVRDVITQRLASARLSDEHWRALKYAAVAGEQFDPGVVGRALGWSDDKLDAILADLGRTNVSAIAMDSSTLPYRYRFMHSLIRESIYVDGYQLPEIERTRIHWQIGEALVDVYGAESTTHLSEVAYHFYWAVPRVDVMKAVDYCQRAGDDHVRRHGYGAGVGEYRRALERLNQKHSKKPEDERLCCELLLSLGEAQNEAWNFDEAQKSLWEAAELAQQLHSPVFLARAAIGIGSGQSRTDQALMSLLEQVREELGEIDAALRVRILARLALGLRVTGSVQRANVLRQDALDAARSLGDLSLVRWLLSYRPGVVVWGPESTPERISIATQLIDRAKETNDVQLATQGYFWRIVDRLELGEIPGVDDDIEQYHDLTRRLTEPYYQRWPLVHGAMRAIMKGEFERGEELAKRAYDKGRTTGDPDVLQGFGCQMMLLAWERGSIGSVLPELKGIMLEFQDQPIWRAALALFLAELGDAAGAQKEWARLVGEGVRGVPYDNYWLPAMVVLAEVCAKLGDVEQAELLYAELVPYQQRHVVGGIGYGYLGSVFRPLGLLAATMRRQDDADKYLEQAIAAHAEAQASPWVARTMYDCAANLFQRARNDDWSRACSMLDRANQIAADIGQTSLIEPVSRLRSELQTRMSAR